MVPQETRSHPHNALGVISGLVIGALAGAAAMLLLAPRSGAETRIQIQKKGVELRERTTEMVEDTMAKVRLSGNKIAIGGGAKIQELKRHGQQLAVEQLNRISEVAEAGKKEIQNPPA